MADRSSRSGTATGTDLWRRRTLLTFAACLPSLAFGAPRAHAQAAQLAFDHVTDRKGFDAALRRAHALRIPVLAYFTAEWCPICKSVDGRVFSKPVIKRRLESIAVVRADMTAVDAGNRALMRHLRVSGPPTMFIVDPKNGREVPRTRLTGAIDANLFLDMINLAGL